MSADDDLGYHSEFASIYDAMRAAYLDVDGDCDQLIAATAAQAGATILDIGSGTGVHAVALAERGYGVIGVEPSPSMADAARRRTRSHPSVGIHNASWEGLGAVVAEASVDVAVSFANVLNCLADESAMATALHALRRALRPGGRALIDVWNRAPIEANGTHDTVRVLETDHGSMVQASTADLSGDRLTIRYRIFVPEADERFHQVTSTHILRILTPVEYRELFERAGLDVVAVLPQRPRSTDPLPDDGADLQSWVVERR